MLSLGIILGNVLICVFGTHVTGMKMWSGANMVTCTCIVSLLSHRFLEQTNIKVHVSYVIYLRRIKYLQLPVALSTSSRGKTVHSKISSTYFGQVSHLTITARLLFFHNFLYNLWKDNIIDNYVNGATKDSIFITSKRLEIGTRIASVEIFD